MSPRPAAASLPAPFPKSDHDLPKDRAPDSGERSGEGRDGVQRHAEPADNGRSPRPRRPGLPGGRPG